MDKNNVIDLNKPAESTEDVLTWKQIRGDEG
jgi:hypothetical protein